MNSFTALRKAFCSSYLGAFGASPVESPHTNKTFLATLLSHNTTLFLGVYEESKQMFLKCKVWYAVESERVYKRP